MPKNMPNTVPLAEPSPDVDPVSVARAVLAKQNEMNIQEGGAEIAEILKRRNLGLGVRQVCSNIPGEQAMSFGVVIYALLEQALK